MNILSGDKSAVIAMLGSVKFEKNYPLIDLKAKYIAFPFTHCDYNFLPN